MADKERYEILKLLGKGRTGGVYEAEDTVLNRKVALRRFFSETGGHDNSKLNEDFANIAQNLCNLQNPNLLTIFDAGTDEDGAYMVSQLLDGTSLADQVAKSCLDAWDACDLASQMLDALQAAHSAGFIHGALTPGSIMMLDRARGGHLYVILDLGLCRLAPLIQGSDSQNSMMADPALMAPELFDGESATEQSDLYMLGQVVYTTLAGGHPLAGLSIPEAAAKHKAGDLPRITDYRPELDPAFADWLHKLISPDPNQRPESAQAAAEELPEVEKTTPQTTTTRQQRVKLVTSSVPSRKTTAVTPITGPQVTIPQAISDRVTVSSSVQSAALPAAEASNKSVNIVFLIIAAVLAIIIGGIFMVMRGGNTTTTADKLKKDQEQVEESLPFASFSSMYAKPSIGQTPENQVNMADADTLDWLILTGLPIKDNMILRYSGGIIKETTPTNKLQPVSYPQPQEKFTISNGKTLHPAVRLDTNKSGLSTKEGWIIKLKAPAKLDGPLKVSTYFVAWKCDVRFRIKTASGKYLEDDYLFKCHGQNVSSEVTATIHDLKPGDDFSIELLVDEFHSGSNPAIMLSAVAIPKP
ncbi:Serine/threonine protein kinase [Rubritalea squalenifaciens DSM 18772]|uniref:Serine/threonine protein kinase n=1 Tax=Rubritalea squalenifaciens DSM 18772 TaxID=1123071 RepID=A0A1M6DUC9_9BACT|nr:serine/threonine-protein kinase [Rubritalea squalenifaciens]SHI76618.1 Serine/threonine protein kinase [Rubritalea squalenifaciens DSM 18772]